MNAYYDRDGQEKHAQDGAQNTHFSDEVAGRTASISGTLGQLKANDTQIVSQFTTPLVDSNQHAAVPTEAPSSSPETKTNTVQAPVLSPRYLHRDLTEVMETISKTVSDIYHQIPIPASIKAALCATTGIGLAAAAISNPVATTGVAAIALWQCALRFEKNRHGRAIGIVGSSLYASHMASLGLIELTVCNCAGTARQIVQSMVADDKPITRALVAIGGFAATAAVYAATTTIGTLFSLANVPLFTLGLGSLSGAFNERYSWASRLTGLTAAGFSIAYHLMVTKSWAGLIASSMFVPGIVWSIREYDLKKRPNIEGSC
jgi:hypothetical protein